MNNSESEFVTMTRSDLEAAKKNAYNNGFRDGYLKCGAEHAEKSRRQFEGYLSPDSMWRAQCIDTIQRQRVAELHARQIGRSW